MRKLKLITILFICSLSTICLGQDDFRILIFDFETLGDNFEIYDGQIIANSIKIGLVKLDAKNKISLIERENLSQLLSDRSIVQKTPNLFDEDTVLELGKLLEANYVIFGKLGKSTLFEGVSVSLRIISIKTGVCFHAEEKFITNKKDYTAVINDVVNSTANKIKRYNISDNDKSRSKFILELKSIVSSYSNREGFLTRTDNNNKFSSLKFNFSRLDPNSKVIVQFDDLLKITESVKKKKEILNYERNSTLFLNEDGVYFTRWIDNKEVNLESNKRGAISTGYKWKDFLNTKIQYNYSNEPNVVSINGESILYSNTIRASLVYQMLIQIQELFKRNKF